jgi:hypothetical protein
MENLLRRGIATHEYDNHTDIVLAPTIERCLDKHGAYLDRMSKGRFYDLLYLRVAYHFP